MVVKVMLSINTVIIRKKVIVPEMTVATQQEIVTILIAITRIVTTLIATKLTATTRILQRIRIILRLLIMRTIAIRLARQTTKTIRAIHPTVLLLTKVRLITKVIPPTRHLIVKVILAIPRRVQQIMRARAILPKVPTKAPLATIATLPTKVLQTVKVAIPATLIIKTKTIPAKALLTTIRAVPLPM